MIRRLITILILAPVAIVLILLSVFNRESVDVTIFPGDPLFTYSVPLFALLFAALLTGMIIGSMATWFGQGRYRKQVRQHKRELPDLQAAAAAKQDSPTSAVPALR